MPASRSSTALLVIDMQVAALARSVDVPGVVERINELVRRARRDGAAVVFIQHEDPSDPEMTAGSAGWQLDERLERLDGDVVVAKTYRDSFTSAGLNDALGRAEARRLVVTGAHSDFCVQTTVLSALVHGYDVTLVSDAHTTTPTSLPNGPLAAETIVALVNSRVLTMRHPGRTVEVVPADAVTM